MNLECYATRLQNRQYNFKPCKNVMKYKDKPKYVSIRHMTGKLLQIDQRNKKGQNDGRIYFDKNGPHVEKHAQFA